MPKTPIERVNDIKTEPSFKKDAPVEEIKKAKDNLLTKANELATKVYQQAQAAQQATQNDSKDSKDDVVDADYTEAN